VIASKSDKPVIGVPVSGTLNGMDALHSIAQMPKGVPVACVGVDNGDNAAWLAARILGLLKKYQRLSCFYALSGPFSSSEGIHTGKARRRLHSPAATDPSASG
jgi:hypothetical protein